MCQNVNIIIRAMCKSLPIQRWHRRRLFTRTKCRISHSERVQCEYKHTFHKRTSFTHLGLIEPIFDFAADRLAAAAILFAVVRFPFISLPIFDVWRSTFWTSSTYTSNNMCVLCVWGKKKMSNKYTHFRCCYLSLPLLYNNEILQSHQRHIRFSNVTLSMEIKISNGSHRLCVNSWCLLSRTKPVSIRIMWPNFAPNQTFALTYTYRLSHSRSRA